MFGATPSQQSRKARASRIARYSSAVGGTILGRTRAFRKGTLGGVGSLLSNKWSQKAREASRTLTRQKIQIGSVVQEGPGGSLSDVYHRPGRLPIPRSVVKALSPYLYSNNAQGQSVGAIGRQTPVTLLNLGGAQELLTVSQLYTGAGAVNKMLVETIRAQMLLSNNMLGPCSFTIYDIVARKDCSAASISDPASAWAQAISDESTGASFSYVVGATPFNAQAFTQYYKIVKTTKVVLGAGSVHRHVVTTRPNRILDYEYIGNTIYNIAGVSTFCMVVHNGMPACDSTTATSVRLGKSTLNLIGSWEYQVKFLANSSQKVVQVNNLTTSFPVAEEIFNQGSGAPVANIQI